MIEQVYMSECIKHFHKGFRELWGLAKYHDKEAPALFIGMYTIADMQALKNHQGEKRVIFSGADMDNSPIVDCPIVASDYQAARLRTLQPITIVRDMPYRSFDNFKPEPLGEKIYCYQNADTQGNRTKYRHDLLQKVIDKFGDRVIVGHHPHTEKEMIEIYKECAIGLQFNPMAGFTSTKELAHMGRMSFSLRPTPFTHDYTEHNIVERIENVLNSVSVPEWVATDAQKFVNIGKDWLK